LAVTEGHVGESLFTDEMVQNHRIKGLMKRTRIRENGDFQESEAIATIFLKDGNRFTKHITAPRGDPRNPLSFDDLVEKFYDLSRGMLHDTNIEQIISMIWDLEKQEDIPGLLKKCCLMDA
jgi:2-methylcitrate dehydratase